MLEDVFQLALVAVVAAVFASALSFYMPESAARN
jgi:hypothetical protein